LFSKNCVDGRERKLDGAAKIVGRLCAHFLCLPACLSASEFQGAGRQKPRFSQSCAQPKRWTQQVLLWRWFVGLAYWGKDIYCV
jgi:hypothetical protein